MMNIDRKRLFQPAFLICAGVLAFAGVTQSYIINKLGIYFAKEPLPLKNSLSDMDEELIKPYVVINKSRIENPDIEEELGTEEYLQWLIEDPQAGKSSPVRYCSLFVTYYTGNPDRVPHVPDECYVGAGNQRLSGEIVELGEGIRPSEVRRVVFTSGSGGIFSAGNKYSVMYFFKVNGEYSAGRTETRSIMGKNFFNKYSYFSKVEWKFFGPGFGNSLIYPDREEGIEASRKLLERLTPALEEYHWPEWETK